MLRAQQSVLMAAVMLLPTVAWSPSVCCCKTPEPIDTRRQAREAPVKTIIRPHWRQLANTIDRYVRRRRCSVMHRIAAYCYCCSVVCVTDGLCVPCENGGTERDAVVCDVDSSCGPDEPRVTHQPVSPWVPAICGNVQTCKRSICSTSYARRQTTAVSRLAIPVYTVQQLAVAGDIAIFRFSRWRPSAVNEC